MPDRNRGFHIRIYATQLTILPSLSLGVFALLRRRRN